MLIGLPMVLLFALNITNILVNGVLFPATLNIILGIAAFLFSCYLLVLANRPLLRFMRTGIDFDASLGVGFVPYSAIEIIKFEPEDRLSVQLAEPLGFREKLRLFNFFSVSSALLAMSGQRKFWYDINWPDRPVRVRSEWIEVTYDRILPSADALRKRLREVGVVEKAY